MVTEIVPYARRRDWYLIPREWAVQISEAPGIQLFGRDNVGVHRTHLPLLAQLGHESAQRLLTVPKVDQARAALDNETAQLGFTLRPYQHEAREYIEPRRGVLLADMMRLGKTLSSVMAHDPARGPLLIVGPLAAREVWTRWMKLRWPDIEPIVLRGRTYSPDQLREAECIFAHYDILTAWQNFALRRPGTLVFDEAHLLSNPRAKRTQAAQLLASRAEKVIAATGTPLWNRPGGLWAILSCLNPGGWGTHYTFRQRYAGPELTAYGTKYNGVSNVEEFRARIAEVMIRRTWEDVRSDLPPIERSVEVADVTERQLFELDLAVEAARDVTKKPTKIGSQARLRKLLGRLKAPLAVDVADRVLANGEPVVVWTWHRTVARKIAAAISKKGYPAFAATGGDSVDSREKTIEDWKKNAIAALVCTIPVGQVAIDLSHARQAIFAEVDFTPATVAQAEMRTFSPDKPMSVTYLVVDHPVDRGLVTALQEKCARANSLNVPAADSAIDVIAQAFQIDPVEPDMQRLMEAFLAGAEDVG
jgi:SNF2 family DNA or RNA helicase